VLPTSSVYDWTLVLIFFQDIFLDHLQSYMDAKNSANKKSLHTWDHVLFDESQSMIEDKKHIIRNWRRKPKFLGKNEVTTSCAPVVQVRSPKCKMSHFNLNSQCKKGWMDGDWCWNTFSSPSSYPLQACAFSWWTILINLCLLTCLASSIYTLIQQMDADWCCNTFSSPSSYPLQALAFFSWTILINLSLLTCSSAHLLA